MSGHVISSESPPQTRADLEKYACTCNVPGCAGGVLLIRCAKHHETGVLAAYEHETGCIVFGCGECSRRLFAVQVAWTVPT